MRATATSEAANEELAMEQPPSCHALRRSRWEVCTARHNCFLPDSRLNISRMPPFACAPPCWHALSHYPIRMLRAAHDIAQVADPNQAKPGPVLSGKGLPECICELPVEEQWLTHDCVVTDRFRLSQAMGPQLLVGMQVLPDALRGLKSRNTCTPGWCVSSR